MAVCRRGLASQLKTMMDEIALLRVGAFAPFSPQPTVRAVLLLLSSAGGVGVLQYLSLW
jgi:hypothetical protein